MLRYFVVSATAGGRYDTTINRVDALTARKAHQLCIDDYLNSYRLPEDMEIYTRTLFETDDPNEATDFIRNIFEQTGRKSVGHQERHRQHH